MTTSQDRLYTFKWLRIMLYKQFYQCEGCHKILKSVPYQNGPLLFQKILVAVGFNLLMCLSLHVRVYNCLG